MTAPAWLRGGLLLALTFGAGAAAGVGFERRRATRHDAAADAGQHLLRHLSDELRLDPAQARAVAAILARRQHAVDSTWHSMRGHVHATLDSTLRDVLAVLRPEQAARLQRMVGTRHPGTAR